MTDEARVQAIRQRVDEQQHVNFPTRADVIFLLDQLSAAEARAASSEQERDKAIAELEESTLESVARFYPKRWFGDTEAVTWRQILEGFDALHEELEYWRIGAATSEQRLASAEAQLQQLQKER